MKSVPPPSCCSKIVAIIVFFISFGVLHPVAAASETSGSQVGATLRFAVPDAQADALWQHLSTQYTTAAFKKLNPALSAAASRTAFTDVYLDDAGQSLLQNQAAVALRNKVSAPAPASVAVQLPEKLAEQNYLQFTFASRAMASAENWLQALQPDQQTSVSQALENFGLSATDLKPRLKLQKHQQQILVREKGEVILILTHQTVSTRKPACTFTEFEITQVSNSAAATALRQDIQKKITERFPLIQPETKLHYIKMAGLHAQRPQLLVSSTVGWLGLVLLLGSMSVLVLRRHRKRHI